MQLNLKRSNVCKSSSGGGGNTAAC
jgi:hypothetical protein